MGATCDGDRELFAPLPKWVKLIGGGFLQSPHAYAPQAFGNVRTAFGGTEHTIYPGVHFLCDKDPGKNCGRIAAESLLKTNSGVTLILNDPGEHQHIPQRHGKLVYGK